MAFLMTMIIAFGFCIIMNVLFMERYYVKDKIDNIVKAYVSTQDAILNGRDITSYDFDEEISHICERYNIEMLVYDNDTKRVKASSSSEKNADVMKEVVLSNLNALNDESYLDPTRDVKKLQKGENYTLQLDTDRVNDIEYLEMWGIVGEDYLVFVRTTVQSIRDNVKISNTFMAMTAFTALSIGAILVLFISKKVTAPIQKLYHISDEMKRLNFEAKFEDSGVHKNEIDILGQNMNELSEILEASIKDLKNANIALKQDIAKKEEIDEMRKEFLSNVSHELKTPIALIQGYAEGLKEGINDDEESKDFYCEVIMDEASKMNIMVKKLLTLNQLEFGNEGATMERFDIVELVKNYIKSAELLARQKEATVKIGNYKPIFVWGDEFRVEEVLQNYYSNALNHIGGERVVDIKITEKDNKVRVSVFNTGNPIPEDSLKHIWDKFYKVDKARTREYGGSGVGLSIVKAIMESMNQDYGVINYDNGVEFYFELETK
ncbi:MAG: two-component sensor histidine kinase [Butyrivibrio sp.]|nr:two-component sensor histidine kinase [Butyrivibrio sp.]